MPGGSTFFQQSWLKKKDCNGVEVGLWLRELKLKPKKAECTLCYSQFNIDNQGFPQVEQHAKTEKHKGKSDLRFSPNDRHKGQIKLVPLTVTANDKSSHVASTNTVSSVSTSDEKLSEQEPRKMLTINP